MDVWVFNTLQYWRHSMPKFDIATRSRVPLASNFHRWCRPWSTTIKSSFCFDSVRLCRNETWTYMYEFWIPTLQYWRDSNTKFDIATTLRVPWASNLHRWCRPWSTTIKSTFCFNSVRLCRNETWTYSVPNYKTRIFTFWRFGLFLQNHVHYGCVLYMKMISYSYCTQWLLWLLIRW